MRLNYRRLLKRISWGLLATGIIAGVIFAYLIMVIRYAETETIALNNYRASINAMPDVNAVHSVHRFNGLESYIVAAVEYESGDDVHFFIRDGAVQHFFFTNDLITEQVAMAIAQSQHPEGTIVNSQLGIIFVTPIFEIQIEHENAVHYVVIDARTREIMMNFET